MDLRKEREEWNKQLRERYERILKFVQEAKPPVAAKEIDALVEHLPGSVHFPTKDIYANVVYAALAKQGILVAGRHAATYQGRTPPKNAQDFDDWVSALTLGGHPEKLPEWDGAPR
jgi:cysteine sulfinate desulfinase/cysteine desulfurase-like protein